MDSETAEQHSEFCIGYESRKWLRDGKLASKDVRLNVKPISIDDYEDSVEQILKPS